VLCAQQGKSGVANIVVMDADGNNYRELTGGDTVDAAPAWVPGQPGLVLFQSSGLARNPAGYVVAHGPTSIQMANTAAGSLAVVLEDARLDFLQPGVGPDGFLYFIRRPYEAPRHGAQNILTDMLMFPFRLLQAVVHYLNFFSLMYSRKPLIMASGPVVQADLKEIQGKRLDAQAALRGGVRLNGVPSLVPASWQLVRRSPHGQEHVLASHVASFDIAADGTVLFSNGYGVFALDGSNPPQVLLKVDCGRHCRTAGNRRRAGVARMEAAPSAISLANGPVFPGFRYARSGCMSGAWINYSRSRPAISACHGATRRSTMPIRPLRPIAITINTTIGTNMVAVSKLLAELIMMAPRPEMVVKNSAITMATTARPTARRIPAMM
jgi:hypothetical protein